MAFFISLILLLYDKLHGMESVWNLNLFLEEMHFTLLFTKEISSEYFNNTEMISNLDLFILISVVVFGAGSYAEYVNGEDH